jgi:NAD(P)-dependent dehydrogenase (short-subunit alcohol dehydrogenase family)
MKKILITGSTRGLGKCIKEFLISKGYYVYGTTRNPETINEEKNFKLLQLDLCDQTSIDNLANYFNKLNEPLDGIIHNAGIAFLDPIEIMDDEEYRRIFEVNFFGPVNLTKKLLPHLKKLSKSNIIFISSIVSVDYWPYLGAYSASKRAVESIAFEWAMLLKEWGINVSVLQPNPLPTDMTIMRSKNAATSHYPDLKNRLLQWEKVETVNELIHEILQTDNPNFQYQTGKYSKQAASKFIKQDAYQNSLHNYQNCFHELIKEKKRTKF